MWRNKVFKCRSTKDFVPQHPHYADIDDCESGLCQHGGTCVDDVNSYYCHCAAGYVGTACETGMYLHLTIY